MARRRAPLWKRLCWLGATLVAVEVLYLVVGNLFLYFGLARILSRSPEQMQTTYDSAYTMLPGVAHVRGFRMRRQDRNTQWLLYVEEADVTVELLDLVHASFHASRIRAAGVSFRLRRKLTDEGALAPRAAEVPPIPGYDDPPRLPIGPPVDPEKGKGWTIFMEDVVAELAEVWVDEWRLLGPATARGGFFKSRHLLQVGPARLDVDQGEGQIGHEPALVGLDAHGDVIIGVVDFRWPIERAVKAISARGTLDAHVPSAAFVRVYLGAPPVVALEDGSGPLHIDFRMHHGLTKPPSKLTFESDRLVLTKDSFSATSSFAFTAQVEPQPDGPVGTADLTLRRTTVALDGHAGAPPVIEDGHIHFRGLPLELAAPVEVEHTTIDLPVHLPDLGWTLPKKQARGEAPVQLSGSATARAHVELDGRFVASGTTSTHTDRATLTVPGYVVAARVTTTSGFDGADYRTKSLTLRPGAVVADQVTIARHGRVHGGGVVRLDVASGRVDRGIPRDVALSIRARHPDLAWLDHEMGKAKMRPQTGELTTELLVRYPAALLDGTAEEATVTGKVDASATGDAYYGDTKLAIHARTRTVIDALDIGRRTLRLTGTHVELRDVAITRGTSRTDHWWGDFDAPIFTSRLAKSAELAAQVETRCQSGAPFSSILTSAGLLPGWVGAIFPMNDLAVSGKVSLQHGLVDFGLRAKGSSATVTADVQHANKGANGAVLAKTGFLSLGVDLAEGKAHMKVFAGQAWLDKRIEEVEAAKVSASPEVGAPAMPPRASAR